MRKTDLRMKLVRKKSSKGIRQKKCIWNKKKNGIKIIYNYIDYDRYNKLSNYFSNWNNILYNGCWYYIILVNAFWVRFRPRFISDILDPVYSTIKSILPTTFDLLILLL